MQAVLHTEGPLLLLAGAGTGKTKVLTSRIVHILRQNLAQSYNILAVTFTNKASKEMSDRVSQMVDSTGITIGTFHAIASRILRQQVEHLGLPLNQRFNIINADDQLKLLKDILKQQGVDLQKFPHKLVHVIIARWKDSGMLPSKISESDIKSAIDKVASTAYISYQDALLSSNLVDFGDLLLYNNELFIHNPNILRYYQDKFKYIFVDEYQDTNTTQYLWVRMLADLTKNICVVGDDDQSIYGWRGADVGNILRFTKDFANAKTIKLEQNYRSSAEILKAASSLIHHNKIRHDKTLWTEQVHGEKVKIISCFDDRDEARYITNEIKKNINKKYIGSQVAILVRAGFQTRSFEEVFISNALAYKIVGGFRFYERMEIRDMLAYVRLTLNHSDNLAFERIINVPKRSIGASMLLKIKEFSVENKLSMFDATSLMLDQKIFKPKIRENLFNFVHNIKTWREKFVSDKPHNITELLLKDSGYLQMLRDEKTDEATSRIENIYEMLRAIADFPNIAEFMEHASLVMDNDALADDLGGSVTIMTLHAAKGLEFDLVFIPSMEEGIFPHQRAIDQDGQKGIEEERRIAYVGITRARKELYLTFAERRRMFYETCYNAPSRFIAEIPDHISIKKSSNSY